jgi:ABC-type microcin C transport system permease subunit YejE
MKTISKIRQRIANFDKDERGMETLQVVLIVAVAAIILALIVNQWPNIKTWAENAIKAVTGFKT